MEEYKIADDKLYDSSGKHVRKIFNSKIRNFIIEKSSNIKELIFINCNIKEMKIMRLKAKPIKITFIGCRINMLKVYKSYVPNIKFICCDVVNSEFMYSNLAGIVFSKDRIEEVDEKINKFIKDNLNIGINTKRKKSLKIYESRISTSKFIFCIMNNMRVDNTVFSGIDIKHCELKKIVLSCGVIINNADMRGSTFFKPNFGQCQFKNVRVNRDFFPIEIICFLLKTFLKFFSYFNLFRIIRDLRNSSMPQENIKHKQLRRKIVKCRNFTKRLLYEIRLPTFIDKLSSTDIYRPVYGEANFSEAHQLYWHIQDIDFINSLKKKYPNLAIIFFLTTNFLRSITALVISCFLTIYLFSLAYSSSLTDFKIDSSYMGTDQSEILDNIDRPKNSLYLSFRIFSIGEHSPLETTDEITEAIIIFERILGALAFVMLAAIIGFPISRRFSLPQKGRPDEET
jgi:uncharacterized protein YjbI with pentapeptide repeats